MLYDCIIYRLVDSKDNHIYINTDTRIKKRACNHVKYSWDHSKSLRLRFTWQWKSCRCRIKFLVAFVVVVILLHLIFGHLLFALWRCDHQSPTCSHRLIVIIFNNLKLRANLLNYVFALFGAVDQFKTVITAQHRLLSVHLNGPTNVRAYSFNNHSPVRNIARSKHKQKLQTHSKITNMYKQQVVISSFRFACCLVK